VAQPFSVAEKPDPFHRRKGNGFSRAAQLRNNSDFEFVLEGTAFMPLS